QRVDATVTPQITADETFFEFLFSAGPTPFATWRERALAGEPLPAFSLPGVTVTIDVNNTYEVVTTELTKNVVGLIEGTDPVLKDTYVFYGAHLDHTGYRTAATAGRGGRGGGGGAQPGSGAPPDLIFNGADDDGSGSTGLLGVAKAFATGPKPRRSVVFVWHAAEESGLLGSRYMADHPVVPIDRIQAVLNADMIGRNRNDDPALSNTVYVIGADRISTDLHNLVVDTNEAMAQPLTLDYEYNDPNDSNSFYTRSDHYSYAAKGIPIAFFFTGTHADYHQASDEVDKILFPKLGRIADLMYKAGFHVANSERPLVRDNQGPRAGVGFSGRIAR
ncbi:MAG TPA: M20/M25/M40 family metallo-hydrolase, partial [Vicinamibacterales bacterium]|nr:M20/M25/M40 family metallo-hydrolase [Vicinamibacterales bacterium]